MSKKRIKSRPGLFGTVHYYDENGNHIGKSRPGLLEGTRVYTDRDGNYAGKSRPGIFAKEVFTDEDNEQITSYEGLFGDVHFRDGAPIGYSRPGFFESTHTTLEVEDEEGFYGEEDLIDTFEEEIEEVPIAPQTAPKQSGNTFWWVLVICGIIAYFLFRSR